jgi:hypothetical protein
VVIVEPSGQVVGDTLHLAGHLPPPAAAAVEAELGELADLLDLHFVDDAVVIDEVPAPPFLPVAYPAAATFVDESDESFDSDPGLLFEVVAGYLNRGTAQLTIVAYADPSDPPTAHLALSRAEHVHQQLIELGVDPSRLAVETGDLLDAPLGQGIDDPPQQRIDLLFRLPS